MGSYEPKYLIFVDGNDNHNKYYEMTPNGDSFTVKYGRVGQTATEMTYPISKWNTKYNEKIKKGYTDQTVLRVELIKKEKNKEYKEIESLIVKTIVERLQQMSKQAIAENYTISSSNVTQKMIDEAQLQLNRLSKSKDVSEFNKLLIDLFQIIPRKMGKVVNYIATSVDNFNDIIQREQDLLDIMATKVIQNTIEEEDGNDENQPDKTILDAMGLRFEEVDDEDIKIIKKQLGESADRFYQAWRVTNIKTQEKFDKFVKDNDIKDIRLLWHGSRSENFWSIINTGLILRPNAQIQGKMFGYGLYFAPKAQKSIGYTSVSGSYWARGNGGSGFMALNEVAYGQPYVVYNFDSKYYDFNYDKLQQYQKGANCLHAKADRGMLRNDEIIVYKEEQCTIKYLVEIK